MACVDDERIDQFIDQVTAWFKQELVERKTEIRLALGGIPSTTQFETFRQYFVAISSAEDREARKRMIVAKVEKYSHRDVSGCLCDEIAADTKCHWRSSGRGRTRLIRFFNDRGVEKLRLDKSKITQLKAFEIVAEIFHRGPEAIAKTYKNRPRD